MKLRISIIGCLLLAGCGSLVSNSDVPTGPYLGIEPRPSISDVPSVRIFDGDTQTRGDGVAVSGTSCMNKLWQEQPTRENAIALMKKQAASQGLKAIYSVKIESESTSLAKNCWASITARGIAYADVQPERPTLDQLVHKHTVDNEKNMDEAAALVKPLFECVKRRAISPELYTTSESADVLARAVVGLCSQEEGAYQGAVYKLAMTSSVNPAELIHDIHQKGLDYALTIIVEVRQRLHNPSPSSEKPVKSKEEPA